MSSLLNIITSKMSYLTAKHNSISSNIANTKTSGYTARQIQPFDLEKLKNQKDSRVKISTTSTKHINSAIKTHSTHRLIDTKRKVNLENEAINLQANSLEYRQASEIYSKISSILKSSYQSGN